MMTVRDLRDAIKPGLPLTPDDSVARAVRVLRARGLPALPVADQGRLVGLVWQSDLIQLLGGAPEPSRIARTTPVSQTMRPIALIAGEHQPLASVAHALRESAAAAVPVSASDGRYLGMLLVRDVLAAISDQPVVPPVAGLATPRGVYLTTGALRAGAGDLALVGTGAVLMTINLVALAIVYGIGTLMRHLLPEGGAAAAAEAPESVVLTAMVIAYAFQVAVFLLLLRISPLTPIHGAEHMVVRAIEEGEDLTPQKVRQMPRVHPRCGTNLMALLILLIIAQQFISSAGELVSGAAGFLGLLVLVMIVLVTWRRLGAGLQRWVTTRRPSDRQLGQAIEVGEELLEAVRSSPGARTGMARRIWNSGFLQVLIGFTAVALVVEYGGPLLSHWWRLLTG